MKKREKHKDRITAALADKEKITHMSNVLRRFIKLNGKQFCIVSESFKLEGKTPHVKVFKKLDTQVENIPKR